MPKEYVESMFAGTSPHTMTGVGPKEYEESVRAGTAPPAFRAVVCWGSNDYVQVATVNPEAPLGDVESGLYVDLDRRGINDLIRLLRKARDRAYGRDE